MSAAYAARFSSEDIPVKFNPTVKPKKLYNSPISRASREAKYSFTVTT